MATYYLDTDSLATATGIWTNANLTVKAANGFYQKDGVYRRISNGELLSPQNCPECYFAFGSSLVQTTSTAACSSTITQTYYFGNVDGVFGENEPEIGDTVFSDSEATTPLGAGFYKLVSGSYIEVNSLGVVIAKAMCDAPPSICVNSFGASMAPCQGGTQDDHMEGFVNLSANTTTDAEFTLSVGYLPGVVGGNCSNVNTFIDLFVTVPAGTSEGLLNCTNGAPFIDNNGATICSVTITNGPYSLC